MGICLITRLPPVRSMSLCRNCQGETDMRVVIAPDSYKGSLSAVGVARVARKFDVPVFCLSGGLGEGADDILAQGIDAVMSICDRPMALEECMSAASALIENGSTRLSRIIRAATRTRG